MSVNASKPEKPTITVCVTSYNQKDYVSQCLDGILAQDVDLPIEILVGDDGSADGTADIVDDYARRDPRIVVINRPQNLGFARNQEDLFRRARGEFVAICEADDFWVDPHKLRRQVSIMRDRPESALCITAGFKVSEDGARRLGGIRISPVSRELGLEELIREVGGRVPTASLLMRRSALTAIPEETYRQVVIDYSLQLLLALHGTVWYDATETCAYRVSSHGSWSEGLASSSAKFLAHHEALRDYEQFLEAHLPSRYARDLRKAFEPLILGFYMSSSIQASDKRRNLPRDISRLSPRGRLIATVLTRVPALVRAGALARRRIWGPFLKPLFGR